MEAGGFVVSVETIVSFLQERKGFKGKQNPSSIPYYPREQQIPAVT